MPLLRENEIAEVVKNKFDGSEEVSRAVGKMVGSATIKQLLELADLVEDKSRASEWENIWNTLITADFKNEIE